MHTVSFIVFGLFAVGFSGITVSRFIAADTSDHEYTVSVDNVTVACGFVAILCALGFIAVGVHGAWLLLT